MNAAQKPLQTTLEQMLDKIKALQPKLRERAAYTREHHCIPDETIQELQEMGFFLTLQPKRWGGLEMTPQDFFQQQIAIAEGCMSTAWAGGIIAVHAYQIALMDERVQEEIWRDNIHTRISSAYAPMGKVEPVEGGFRFSGRWGWSSGCDHCTWVLLGGIVPGEGYRTFLLPKSDYRIEKTWNAMGLQGTGSNDIVVEDAFVPDYRTHKQMDGFLLNNPGTKVNTQPVYQLPWAQLFVRTVSSPAIGACKEALRLYKEGALGKQSGDPTKLAGDTATQERIARAAQDIHEMESVLYRNFDDMMALLNQGKEVPLEDRIRARFQASLVIEKSIKVVDSLFEVSGGASVFKGSDIQYRFLDIHTARAHVANNPTAFARNYGATQLGVENSDYFV
jgi:3-hydroxy-9,10-secoandrosta-1,3,5(10)-triene-9,17-dione monooxygenase